MMKSRGLSASQPPSPTASDEDDPARSPVSDEKSPTGTERGRKGRKGLTVLNDELKRDPLDIVH